MPEQPEAPTVIHPGDVIQLGGPVTKRGVILTVIGCHSWGLGCALTVPGSVDGADHLYHRVPRDTPLAKIGVAVIMTPEVEEARRASLRTQHNIAADKASGE